MIRALKYTGWLILAAVLLAAEAFALWLASRGDGQAQMVILMQAGAVCAAIGLRAGR